MRERLAQVCPPGLEIQTCETVRLAGHVLAKVSWDPGLGKLIQAVDVVIRPAADGMPYDEARLGRIVGAFLAKDSVLVPRGANGDKKARDIDVRGLALDASVLAGDAAAKLCAVLEWPDAPALISVRVRATVEGSAKPAELAKAFGVWGPDDPRADHALVTRLGVVTGSTEQVYANPAKTHTARATDA